MVIVLGTEHNFESIGTVDAPCPRCGFAPTSLERSKKKGTIYWVPVLSLDTGYALWCPSCMQHWKIDQVIGRQLQQQQVRGRTQVPAGTGAAVNARQVPPPPSTSRSAPPRGQGKRRVATTAAPRGVVPPRRKRTLPPAPRRQRCPTCGHTVGAGRFCSHCGASLTSRPAGGVKPGAPHRSRTRAAR
jgi:hypothetical protein